MISKLTIGNVLCRENIGFQCVFVPQLKCKGVSPNIMQGSRICLTLTSFYLSHYGSQFLLKRFCMYLYYFFSYGVPSSESFLIILIKTLYDCWPAVTVSEQTSAKTVLLSDRSN